jgi:hypothetical protein
MILVMAFSLPDKNRSIVFDQFDRVTDLDRHGQFLPTQDSTSHRRLSAGLAPRLRGLEDQRPIAPVRHIVVAGTIR